MNIFTEKNKISPSQESVVCVFDKRTGLHKFWSEYTFLAEMTKSEMKYFKEEKNLPYPLSIKKSGPQVYLEFIDPVTGNSNYTSEKMYRKKMYDYYLKDENFRNAFDYVMSIAVEQRITNGLFQLKTSGAIQTIVSPDEAIDENIITSPEMETTTEEVKEETTTEIKEETEEVSTNISDEEMMYEPVFKD